MDENITQPENVPDDLIFHWDGLAFSYNPVSDEWGCWNAKYPSIAGMGITQIEAARDYLKKMEETKPLLDKIKLLKSKTKPLKSTDENITHPGGLETTTEFDIGWRTAFAQCWRSIEFALSGDECRNIISKLGNKPPTRELIKRNG